MRVLVIWADPGSTNIGLQALAAGNEALVKRVWPHARVEFHRALAEGTAMHIAGFRAEVKERLTGRNGLVDWLSQFDLVLDTRSGDSFSDLYGLKRQASMTLLGDAVRRAGVPLVLSPQTIGPFTRAAARTLARTSLRRAQRVMVRDSRSAEVVEALGGIVHAAATDLVFALPVVAAQQRRDVVLNVSGLLWAENPHVSNVAYQATIRAVLAALLGVGRQVTLLAHVLESGFPDSDVEAVLAVGRELGDSVEVVIPEGLAEVRTVVGSAQLTVGSRMHACLNSLSVGTPAVPLAYSRKFEPLLRDIGWAHTVDLRRHPDPAAALLTAIEDADRLRREVDATLQRAHALVDVAERCLGSL
jgi:polysaccharide pyruvyl transferase WcaK-like protein